VTLLHLKTFQLVVGPVLGVLFFFSLAHATRGSHRRAAAVRALVWLAALLTVLWPDSTLRVARIMGIGRGTDLVLYFFVIAFLCAGFYFYGRTLQLETALTSIVRQMALRDAAQAAPPRDETQLRVPTAPLQ
jgi:small membrane protein